MYNSYAKIGQVWEWKYCFPFSSSIYLIVNKNKLYDGESVISSMVQSKLPSHLTQYIFDLIEISSTNTKIQVDFMEADNWKLLIDVEPNR